MGTPTVPTLRSTHVTLDAFYQMDDLPEWGAELADGALVVTPPPSGEHGWLATVVYDVLRDYVVAHALGKCFPDGFGYELPVPGRPDTCRTPDVSFVRSERVRLTRRRGRAPALAPDLAVEVKSPSDTPRVLAGKLADYLEAGTALVWIIDGDARTAEVHARRAPMRVLRDADALEGGAVLPGFTLPLARLFAELDD